MKNRLLSYMTTALVILLLPLQSAYMQGHKIDVTISGLKDTSLILSYRYGTKFYTVDTVRTNDKGFARFTGTGDLDRGMYQLVLPDRSFVDFFIDKSQNFSVQTSLGSLIKSLHSKDNIPNELFFKWQVKNQQLRSRAQMGQKKLEASAKGSPEYAAAMNEMSLLRAENQNLWDNTIASMKDYLAGKFLKGMKPLEVPQVVYMDKDGKVDQQAQYHYYKEHFFDYVDFTDPALIRTPLINSKLEQYFSKVVPAIPDSVKGYVDKVISLSESHPEMFQFVVQYLLNYYSEKKIMGMDAIYVHIAEKYYLTGRAIWIDEDNLRFIATRVNILKPLLIGKQAPELIGLETPEGERIDVKDINARYTILYFWEPDCAFCKTSTPKLKEVYHQVKNQNIKVVAVNTRLDREPWEEFIVEHELDWINVFAPNDVRSVLNLYDAYNTPKLFILDKDKKIVAKDIGVDQTLEILQYLFNKEK